MSMRFLWAVPLGSIFEQMLIYIRICSMLPTAPADLGHWTLVAGRRHLIPDSRNYHAIMVFYWDFRRFDGFVRALAGLNNTLWTASPQALLLSLNDHNTYRIL